MISTVPAGAADALATAAWDPATVLLDVIYAPWPTAPAERRHGGRLPGGGRPRGAAAPGRRPGRADDGPARPHRGDGGGAHGRGGRRAGDRPACGGQPRVPSARTSLDSRSSSRSIGPDTQRDGARPGRCPTPGSRRPSRPPAPAGGPAAAPAGRPGAVEAGEVAHVGRVQREDARVEGDRPRWRPLAARRGHRAAVADVGEHVVQRRAGLQHVVGGAEQRVVRDDRQLGLLDRRPARA